MIEFALNGTKLRMYETDVDDKIINEFIGDKEQILKYWYQYHDIKPRSKRPKTIAELIGSESK